MSPETVCPSFFRAATPATAIRGSLSTSTARSRRSGASSLSLSGTPARAESFFTVSSRRTWESCCPSISTLRWPASS